MTGASQFPGPEAVGREAPLPVPAVSGPTLVIQTAFLGDVLLTLPLLISLSRSRPVDVVTTPAAAPLLEGQPSVRRVIRFDKRGADRGLPGLRRIGRQLKRERYASVYLPHGSIRSSLLGWLSGAEERIGFDDAAGAWGYTVRRPRPVAHESVRISSLGWDDRPGRPWLLVTPEGRTEADGWRGARGIPDQYLVLAPGSAWETKRWPGFLELARGSRLPVIVLGGPEDRTVGNAIEAAAAGRAWSAAGQLSLPAAAAIVAGARAAVTNDSMALHLATALDRPVVALFGPTVPGFGFGPLGGGAVVQLDDLDCRPCSPHGSRRCPLGHHRCMRDLPVKEVLAAVERHLD